ncbi:DEHA2C01298p [Debaryomyces hansenii CBS767]|jgi:phenylalanyl-tRNA synthetase alpha chain|uniref:Phenylalanine--tRNA ligase alpha subunit n=1 Tax=Debaryomyces hansenii (strain ATCC 36239 / CBS 767 / BCRC 21394 / JCM 1990 / NBRC 0083 / IGC 2968) TaxID=284592 RepID=Q6BVN2_DEBHA|nr:DEHA2C01298p [Debaryomyces hansenii CBS767]CAG85765.1 DEHA2C01298p [Debaryomyces hansenii CBS767]|eukprot:XP_457737.1 DEHA2C01298p [Debaryomyces hansenii CBS767]
MSDLQLQILKSVNEHDGIESTLEVPEFAKIDANTLHSNLTSLWAKEMINFKKIETDKWILTKEAEEFLGAGSHEMRLLEEVMKSLDGLKISDVNAKLGQVGKLGQGKAFKNGWIGKNDDKLVSKVDKLPEDTAVSQLKTIKETGTLDDKKELTELKKRKLVTLTKIVGFNVTKAAKFGLEIVTMETDITSDMITSGKWKDAQFKPYNFNSEGVYPHSGALHPLMKVKEEFRQIFFSMGFTEMPSNQYVETGFWNFDTLFVPQQHPARDLQDTFYLKDPVKAGKPDDMEYWENIRQVHEEGKFGSIGYRYPWREEESLRMVLRTHTTAISAAMLHKLAKDPKPTRLFSIDRVFRNEAVDATHLAEFHQVEGVMAGYDITLGDLIGFMEDFFAKMGVNGLRFKAAYNPYTEPSLEIFAYHKGLGKWVEIGNSGMFRPEMLEPMGLPKNLRVLGWGLSLERPTMIKYGVSNIRELVGHKVSLDFVETNPAARLDEDLV